jgi:transcriptional regulator with XRE-family HTH domain
VPSLQTALGSRIRGLRLQKGFSQESFADHCGLHRTYMGSIERGERNLTIQTVLTVAEGLGISMADLLLGIEKEIEAAKPTVHAKKANRQ